jgi:hypothetical protein
MNRLEKRILREKLIRELEKRNIEDISAFLDNIDLNSLIDPSLSYSENLNNILSYIGYNGGIEDFEEFARINEVKLDPEREIMITYSDNYENREFLSLNEDPIIKLAEYYEQAEREKLNRKKPLDKREKLREIRAKLRAKYPKCPKCGQKYSHIYLKTEGNSIYVYFEHSKVENSFQKKTRCYFGKLRQDQ